MYTIKIVTYALRINYLIFYEAVKFALMTLYYFSTIPFSHIESMFKTLNVLSFISIDSI